MRTFEFKKAHEDIMINGREYRIDLSDEKVLEYQRVFNKYYEESKELAAKSGNAKTPDEQKEFVDKSRELIGETLDMIIGKGSFELLYVESGKSLFNIVDLISFLTDVVKDKANDLTNQHLDKYLKKKKK